MSPDNKRCRRIRRPQRRPGLKVLFTTGYAGNAIEHHGRVDPGVQMIGKPLSMDALASKVRAILDGNGR
jgi:hypothetical protein